MSLEVLALIAARSGSKGLAHKNVRRIGCRTLLERAVSLAFSGGRRGEHWSVVVSTDSERYARIARAAGAEVPFRRPPALASDDARLITVVEHALGALAEQGRLFDLVVLLSATTPLTRASDVRAAVGSWRRHGQAVLSVVAERGMPSWRFGLSGDRLVAPRGRRVRRRQEAAPTYLLNGAIYVASPEWIRRHHQFYAPGARALIMPQSRSLDIENADDLAMARLLVA